MKDKKPRKLKDSGLSVKKRVIHRSAKTGKLVSKKYAETHKSTTTRETVQGLEYWKDRPETDDHRDWGYGGETWLDDYVMSIDHPHRRKIVDLLKTFEWSYLLEVGCCTGPNLALIRLHFPEHALFGIEPNEKAVEKAWMTLPSNIDVQVGDFYALPFADGYFDVVLADAALMYCAPTHIQSVLDELSRVTKKAILIVDRYTEKDSKETHVWSRDYTYLLQAMGFHVTEIRMTDEDWPTSKNWQKYGRYFLAIR